VEKAKQINNQLALNRRAIGARLALNMIAGAGLAPIAAGQTSRRIIVPGREIAKVRAH